MAPALELGNRLNDHLTTLPASFLCFYEKRHCPKNSKWPLIYYKSLSLRTPNKDLQLGQMWLWVVKSLRQGLCIYLSLWYISIAVDKNKLTGHTSNPSSEEAGTVLRVSSQQNTHTSSWWWVPSIFFPSRYLDNGWLFSAYWLCSILVS